MNKDCDDLVATDSINRYLDILHDDADPVQYCIAGIATAFFIEKTKFVQVHKQKRKVIRLCSQPTGKCLKKGKQISSTGKRVNPFYRLIELSHCVILFSRRSGNSLYLIRHH